MAITNIGNPQVEIALSEIGLFELAVDALKQQLELTAISESLSVLGQSAGIQKRSVLSTNQVSYSLSGINTGVHKQYYLFGSVGAYETTNPSTHIRVEKYLEADASSLSVLGISSSILKRSLLSANVSGLSLQTSITDITGQKRVDAGVGSLSLSGSSTRFKFDLNLPANTQALVSQGISAGIHKRSVLSVETRNLIAQAEGIQFSWNKALFPEITPVILGLSKTGLTVQRQASLGVQNLSLTVTDVDLVTARVLNAEDTQLVFTEPIIVFRKFSLQASRISLFIQEQGTILNYNRPFRLNVYDLNLNDSSPWFMRSDLPEGFFRLVRQLESRHSIRTPEEFSLVRQLEFRQSIRTLEENRATIMESP